MSNLFKSQTFDQLFEYRELLLASEPERAAAIPQMWDVCDG